MSCLGLALSRFGQSKCKASSHLSSLHLDLQIEDTAQLGWYCRVATSLLCLLANKLKLGFGFGLRLGVRASVRLQGKKRRKVLMNMAWSYLGIDFTGNDEGILSPILLNGGIKSIGHATT